MPEFYREYVTFRSCRLRPNLLVYVFTIRYARVRVCAYVRVAEQYYGVVPGYVTQF